MAGIAALAALGAGELAVRALGLAPGFGAIEFGQHAGSADPELLWENSRAFDGHSAAGLRGAPLDDTRARPRILVLGDSIAYGFKLPADQTIAVALAAALRANGVSAEVLNGGVCGYNTVQEARLLELRGRELAPAAIVLLYCLNDPVPAGDVPENIFREALRHGQLDAWNTAVAARSFSAPVRFALEHCHLARLLHHLAARPAALPMEDARSKGYADAAYGKDLSLVETGMERLAAAARALGAPVLVAVVPWLGALGENYPFREHHARVLALARAHGMDGLDLLPAMEAHARASGGNGSLPGDPTHPDAAGARAIAAALASRLQSRFERR